MRKYLPLTFLVFMPKLVSAHCPLCTAGAGALAILAAYLGVSSVVVGVMIGAFSLALSFWITDAIKRNYFKFQRVILIVLIFLGTVIPIMPLIRHYAPLYIPFIGEYGTTYAINLYLLGVIIGSIIMFISPYLSRFVTKVRKEKFPYQGVVITLGLLVIASIFIQILS